MSSLRSAFRRDRAGLVAADQPAVADNVRGQNRRELAFRARGHCGTLRLRRRLLPPVDYRRGLLRRQRSDFRQLAPPCLFTEGFAAADLKDAKRCSTSLP